MNGQIVGYRYTCALCGAVLADTSKHPDGTTRGMDGAGAFFVGRKLSDREWPSCTCGKRRNGARVSSEAPVYADTAQAFFDAQDRQERAAAEVGDALRPYGFTWWHTGGGCTAWGKARGKPGTPDYVEILITDGECSAPARLSDPLWIGAYRGPACTGEGQIFPEKKFRTVRAFLRALKSDAPWAREVVK